MLKKAIRGIKESPFGEVISRYREIYGVLEKRGRQTLILLHVTHVISMLMGTMKLFGLAAFFLVLAKPDAVLANRYVSEAYNALGFESKEYFLLLICGVIIGSIIFQQLMGLGLKLINLRLNSALSRRLTLMLYKYYMAESYENIVQRGTNTATAKTLLMASGTVKGEISKTKTLFGAVINGTVLFSVLLVLSTMMALALVTALTLYFVFFFIRYRARIRALGKEQYMKSIEKMRLLREGASGAIELRMSGKEKQFVKRTSALMIEVLRNNIKKTVMNAIPNLVLRMSSALVLYAAAAVVLLSQGMDYSFTALAVFAIAAFRLLPMFRSFFKALMSQENTRHKYQQIMGDLKPAKKAIDEKATLPKKYVPIQIQDALVFDNVDYTYPGMKQPVFKNLDISLPGDSVVALFGKSGSGKTTLIRLASGLLTPAKGKVLLDGRSLHESQAFKEQWQRSFGVTFQKPFFMNASLATNVTLELDKKKMDYDRMHKAIQAAQLEDLVRDLPDGVETELPEDSESLSGGQRQRVAIARSIYRNAPVMVLDEATSAIDMLTEEKIVSYLIRENMKKLIIIISHRLEAMQRADVVVFLQHNHSVAHGTFDQLLRENAEFGNMVSPITTKAV